MKKIQISVIFITITLLALIILFIDKPSDSRNNDISNDSIVKGALQNIFQTKNIKKITEANYLIGGKDYYAQIIGDFDKDDKAEIVVMEPKVGSGKIYRFYKNNEGGYQLIGEEGSLIWYLEEEKNKEIELISKDINGDDVPEIFIPFQENAKGNKWYTLFRFSDQDLKFENLLFKHYSEDKTSRLLDFDALDYQDNYLVTEWHGTYSRGRSYHRLEGIVFINERTVGLFGQPRSNEYEYREIDESGNVTYREKRTGSIWTDPLERNVKTE